jgi:hypothetical protein
VANTSIKASPQTTIITVTSSRQQGSPGRQHAAGTGIAPSGFPLITHLDLFK